MALLVGLGLAISGTAAQAHVHVHADNTTTGSFSALTFRVPNESDTASTTKIAVRLPQDTPLLYVSSKPVPGWRATTTEAPLPKPVESFGTTITKAVRTVTWTADPGSEIGPGEYQEFSISAGPLPAAGTFLLLPTTQTYSDGKVVAWDQPTPDSGEEPEHPAPAFEVLAEEASPTEPAVPVDSLARGLAGGALAVGLVAVVLAGLGLRRRPGAS